MNFEVIKEFFSSYFVENQAIGIIKLIIDILLVVGIIIGFILRKKQEMNITLKAKVNSV